MNGKTRGKGGEGEGRKREWGKGREKRARVPAPLAVAGGHPMGARARSGSQRLRARGGASFLRTTPTAHHTTPRPRFDALRRAASPPRPLQRWETRRRVRPALARVQARAPRVCVRGLPVLGTANSPGREGRARGRVRRVLSRRAFFLSLSVARTARTHGARARVSTEGLLGPLGGVGQAPGVGAPAGVRSRARGRSRVAVCIFSGALGADPRTRRGLGRGGVWQILNVRHSGPHGVSRVCDGGSPPLPVRSATRLTDWPQAWLGWPCVARCAASDRANDGRAAVTGVVRHGIVGRSPRPAGVV